jgi:hypothetical protein
MKNCCVFLVFFCFFLIGDFSMFFVFFVVFFKKIGNQFGDSHEKKVETLSRTNSLRLRRMLTKGVERSGKGLNGE